MGVVTVARLGPRFSNEDSFSSLSLLLTLLDDTVARTVCTVCDTYQSHSE